MNYTARQQDARERIKMRQSDTRERIEVLLVSVIGWATLTIGASLMALAFYTASVIILSN